MSETARDEPGLPPVDDEAARLKRLEEYCILRTAPERAFDEIASLAAGLFDAPVAFICLAEADCHWFKARFGIALEEVPRSVSFCDYTLRGEGVFCIPDTRADPLFAGNPTVTGDLNAGFYAGMPLIDSDGFKLGTLAVLDTNRRDGITPKQAAALESLARIAIDRLEMRRLSSGLIEAEAQAQTAITLAKSAHAHLREAIEILPEGIVFMDAEDRLILWNQRYVELFPEIAAVAAAGIQYEDLLKASVDSGQIPDDIDPDGGAEAWMARRLADHRAKRGTFEQRFRDGRWIRYDQRRTAGGGTIGIRVDITEVKQREESFRLLFENNPLPMLVYEIENLSFLAANAAAVKHYGFTSEQFLGMTLLDIRPPDHREEAENVIRLRKGQASGDHESVHWKADGSRFLASIFAHRGFDYDGRKAGLLTVVDITERRRHEEQIRELAHQDPLTGLANRLRFKQCLDDRLASGADFAVLLIDLDQFKTVNDTLGHTTGDALLVAAGERLRQCIRKSDFVARLGGDEFAIIQQPVEENGEIEALAQRLVTAMMEPYDIQGHRLSIGLSAGLTRAPQDGRDGQTLLQNADLALYRAKGLGRGRFCHFVPQMQLRVLAKRNLEIDLRRAVKRGEFALHYHPMIDLQTGTATGYEALLRWLHPDRGMIAPSKFIPVAEDTGLIEPIAGWVLAEACREASRWRSPLSVGVNLSAKQFKDGAIVELVREALAGSGLEGRRLELEITESVLLEHSSETLVVFNKLRGLGVRIVLDDFGTGYSSLSYLQKFPVDKIKIDRSFIATLGEQPHSREIVRAVIAIGNSLNIQVIAEGIETKEELDALRQLGCRHGQGFYFGQPVQAIAIPPEHRKSQRARARSK